MAVNDAPLLRPTAIRISSDSVLEEDTSKANSRGFEVYAYQQNGSRNTTDEDGNYQSQYENAFAPTNKYECSTAALEKDRYKIRHAFMVAPGNSLIVADYGQIYSLLIGLIEIVAWILTLLTDCKRMLEAFEAGGDFHSRTVMNMYPYICEAVDNKEVLLEWYPHLGDDKPPVPLLKKKVEKSHLFSDPILPPFHHRATVLNLPFPLQNPSNNTPSAHQQNPHAYLHILLQKP
ncbi:unnamed protein product [Vicia faba]|uniref:Uncharacterized protein n=1 Tax=Vicia faba TaxID=3906 RepID=A0AAV0YRM7_VICFA|nr:unnamed protein product [Vicia faba]